MLFCVFASKLITKTGMPFLLLFLGIGILIGSEGVLGIHYNNPYLTKEIGNIALMFIIFYGGMEFPWKSSKEIIPEALAISTIGVLCTGLLFGGFAYVITDMSMLECILLGAIVAPTDAASVFSALGSQKIHIKRRTANILEFESGSNDPVAYLMMIVMISLITKPDYTLADMAWLMFTEIVFGLIVGAIVGYVAVRILSRIRLNIEGLYPVFGIALVMLTYSVTATINGNYFLSIYVAGLIIGNSSFFHKMKLIRFFDNQSWIMQVALFVTLGLQVVPSELMPVAGEGILLALVLMFVIRPLILMPIMTVFKTPLKDQIFIGLVGFRGAASIVFATYPMMAGMQSANYIFNLIFFLALVSVMVQSIMLKPLAKKLNLVAKTHEHDFRLRRFNDFSEDLDDIMLHGVYVAYNSDAVGKHIYELGMPKGISVLAIRQTRDYKVPHRSTKLDKGNRILFTCKEEDQAALALFCKDHGFES